MPMKPFSHPITESTGQAIVDALRAMASSNAAIAAGNASETFTDSVFEAMLDCTNTTTVFKQWWAVASESETDRYKLLSRFFTMAGRVIADKVYTVRFFSASGGSTTAGTAMDDLAPLGKAALATDTDDGGADWSEEHPLTWYVRFNAISKEDGTMDVKAVEGVDDTFDITGTLAPVYTASQALWRKCTVDETYITKSWATSRKAGFKPYAGDVGLDGKKRAFTWHSTFPGALVEGKLTSGAGLKPAIRQSANAGLAAARKWGNNYDALWNDCDSVWLLEMFQLKHWDKENGNILEGCNQYNIQTKVEHVETETTRVLLPEADYDKWHEGSNVSVGDWAQANSDRNNIDTYGIVNLATIVSKAKVNVGGTNYTALNLDVTAPFDLVEEARVSTMPWSSGTTERLAGHRDGSAGPAATNNQFPIRVAGIECMHGAYDICIEPLYTVTSATDGVATHFNYASVHKCRDASKLTDHVTADYVSTGYSLENVPQGWNQLKDMHEDTEVMFPSEFGGSSTQYYKSGFAGSYGTGVRVPWRRAFLNGGAWTGLAALLGHNAPSTGAWYGSPRLSGAGKMRGEWRP